MEHKLTKKENFLRVMHGQIPEYVPVYSQNMVCKPGEYLTNMLFEPSVMRMRKNADGTLV